jgi:hypothetical protein
MQKDMLRCENSNVVFLMLVAMTVHRQILLGMHISFGTKVTDS